MDTTTQPIEAKAKKDREAAAIGVTFPQYRQFRGVVMPIRLDESDDKGVTRTETTREKANT